MPTEGQLRAMPEDIRMETMAHNIFQTAINERRCRELLECLFDGGTATVDAVTRKLVVIPATAMAALNAEGERSVAAAGATTPEPCDCYGGSDEPGYYCPYHAAGATTVAPHPHPFVPGIDIDDPDNPSADWCNTCGERVAPAVAPPAPTEDETLKLLRKAIYDPARFAERELHTDGEPDELHVWQAKACLTAMRSFDLCPQCEGLRRDGVHVSEFSPCVLAAGSSPAGTPHVEGDGDVR